MANKQALRELQQRLAQRMQAAREAPQAANWLAVECAGLGLLLPLKQSGEIFTPVPLQAVPYTQPWMLGVANLRGGLHTVVDLAAFLGLRGPIPMTSAHRLVSINPDLGINCALLVDQLLAGWYGGLAVEVMALGKPVMCYLREEDLGFIPRQMREELPIIRVTPATLEERLREYLTRRRADLADLGERSREFVERHHDPLQVAARLRSDYLQALARRGRGRAGPAEAQVARREGATASDRAAVAGRIKQRNDARFQLGRLGHADSRRTGRRRAKRARRVAASSLMPASASVGPTTPRPRLRP